jgi:hypothetical protein
MATRDRAARLGTPRLLKENDAQYGKRQRTAGGSARPPLQNAPAPPPAPAEAPIEFAGRDDVDALLNEKMKGKNKMDYKVSIFFPFFLFFFFFRADGTSSYSSRFLARWMELPRVLVSSIFPVAIS